MWTKDRMCRVPAINHGLTDEGHKLGYLMFHYISLATETLSKHLPNAGALVL